MLLKGDDEDTVDEGADTDVEESEILFSALKRPRNKRLAIDK